MRLPSKPKGIDLDSISLSKFTITGFSTVPTGKTWFRLDRGLAWPGGIYVSGETFSPTGAVILELGLPSLRGTSISSGQMGLVVYPYGTNSDDYYIRIQSPDGYDIGGYLSPVTYALNPYAVPVLDWCGVVNGRSITVIVPWTSAFSRSRYTLAPSSSQNVGTVPTGECWLVVCSCPASQVSGMNVIIGGINRGRSGLFLCEAGTVIALQNTNSSYTLDIYVGILKLDPVVYFY